MSSRKPGRVPSRSRDPHPIPTCRLGSTKAPDPEVLRLVVLDVLVQERRRRQDVALRLAGVVLAALGPLLTILGWWWR